MTPLSPEQLACQQAHAPFNRMSLSEEAALTDDGRWDRMSARISAHRQRKTIPASTRLDDTTNEEIDQLAAWQGISHAEVLRRAVHNLYESCKRARS